MTLGVLHGIGAETPTQLSMLVITTNLGNSFERSSRALSFRDGNVHLEYGTHDNRKQARLLYQGQDPHFSVGSGQSPPATAFGLVSF